MAKRVLYLLLVVLLSSVNTYAQIQFRGVMAGVMMEGNTLLNHIILLDSLGNYTILTDLAKPYSNVSISPDCKNIVYTIRRDTVVTPRDIEKMNLLPENLKSGLSGVDSPKYAPGGVNYIFKITDTYLLNIKTKQHTLISDPNLFPFAGPYVWSPDSKKILTVYHTPYGVAKGPKANLKGEVWEIDIETGVNRKIEINLGEVYGKRIDLMSPNYSPDHEHILITNNYLGDDIEVFVKNLKSEKVYNLYELGVKNSKVKWAPNSKWLVSFSSTEIELFTTDRTSQLTTINLETLLAQIDIYNFNIGYLFWAPDGKSLAMWINSDNDAGLYIVSSDLKQIRKLNVKPGVFLGSWSSSDERKLESPIILGADLIRYYNPTEYTIFVFLSLWLCLFLTAFAGYKSRKQELGFLIPFTIFPIYYLIFQFEPEIYLNTGYAAFLGATSFVGLKFGQYHARKVFSARKELLMYMLDFGHSGEITRNIDQIVFYTKNLQQKKNDKYLMQRLMESIHLFNYNSIPKIKIIYRSGNEALLIKESKNIKRTLNSIRKKAFLTASPRSLDELVSSNDEMLALNKYISELDKKLQTFFQCDVLAVSRNVKSLFRDNQVEINFDADDDYLAFIDKNEYTFILENLISNSFKANAKSVTVAPRNRLEKIEISIIDDGSGIEESEWETIFNPGYSGTEGTGFGLYRTRELLTKFKGNIQVVESGKSGTTFLITLKKLKI